MSSIINETLVALLGSKSVHLIYISDYFNSSKLYLKQLKRFVMTSNQHWCFVLSVCYSK